MMTIWAAAANRLIAEGKLEAFPGYGGFVAMNRLSCLGRCLAIAGALCAADRTGWLRGWRHADPTSWHTGKEWAPNVDGVPFPGRDA